jgi:hypothetical protein
VRRDRWEIIKQRIDAIPTPTPPKQTRHWREPLSTKRALRAYYRKKQGIRCFSFAITEEHVDGLVFLGKLLPDQRHNRPTVQLAFDAFLREALIQRFENQRQSNNESKTFPPQTPQSKNRDRTGVTDPQPNAPPSHLSRRMLGSDHRFGSASSNPMRPTRSPSPRN